MTNEELIKVYGGADSITSSLINSLCKLAEEVYEFGRSLGSSLRKLRDHNLC